MASKYLRGNCLGMLPSTCRKPICLRLLEVLSYSCTPAAPAQDQALAGPPAARAQGGGRSPRTRPARSSHLRRDRGRLLRGAALLRAMRCGSRGIRIFAQVCGGGRMPTACVCASRTCPANRQIVNEMHGIEALLALKGSTWLPFLSVGNPFSSLIPVICPNQSRRGSSWTRFLLSLFRKFYVVQIRCPLSC